MKFSAAISLCLAVANTQARFCTRDGHICPDGSFVGRDPENDCKFSPCPSKFCTEEVKTCADGSFVGRDPENDCKFFPCRSTGTPYKKPVTYEATPVPTTYKATPVPTTYKATSAPTTYEATPAPTTYEATPSPTSYDDTKTEGNALQNKENSAGVKIPLSLITTTIVVSFLLFQ